MKNNKKLAFGYTTGSCAAAASKAAAIMLLSGKKVDYVELMTPKGILLNLEILQPVIVDENGESYAQCAVKKYSGDDPDVTDNVLVFSRVNKNPHQGVHIDGGKGVGRVTKPGLDQPVGNAAINRVPRQMISDEVTKVIEDMAYDGGMDVIISIPQGEELAEKTFNPRLGIVGGISVLGTSGIVEPMSEDALIASIKAEMSLHCAAGEKYLLITPGNYGTDYAVANFGFDEKDIIQSSNYIGDTIDMAVNLEVKGILFVSHIGKFVKLAAGIMNTHSRCSDARMEILVANALMAGADPDTLKRMMDCVTTDDALSILEEKKIMKEVMDIMMPKIKFYLEHRCRKSIEMGAIVFSNVYGELGRTTNADDLMDLIKKEHNKKD
ncbi:cobalt-precorrin-5B (C(1))-methyltransferase CbiD [Acetitomaculum ruminis]|uniref:cobalt-precorrin-5B (C(1))-methyltransferase CbiD n=1 Tax=Acetitomaculum ruminis TaxID=2382 RepID=UPI002E8DF5CD|nr:cobalt-precorrin-5B (C(1))-methyltransferase CbiD [Acetitomaculum ruminis]